MLAHKNVLFPLLTTLSVNYQLLRQPRYVTAKERCLEIQGDHLNKAAFLRPTLVELNLGCATWSRNQQGWKFIAGEEIADDEWQYDDTDDEDDDTEEVRRKAFAPEVYFHDVPYTVTPPSSANFK